jgi:hypothetical protein
MYHFTLGTEILEFFCYAKGIVFGYKVSSSEAIEIVLYT